VRKSVKRKKIVASGGRVEVEQLKVEKSNGKADSSASGFARAKPEGRNGHLPETTGLESRIHDPC